jgi:hypothetical protein
VLRGIPSVDAGGGPSRRSRAHVAPSRSSTARDHRTRARPKTLGAPWPCRHRGRHALVLAERPPGERPDYARRVGVLGLFEVAELGADRCLGQVRVPRGPASTICSITNVIGFAPSSQRKTSSRRPRTRGPKSAIARCLAESSGGLARRSPSGSTAPLLKLAADPLDRCARDAQRARRLRADLVAARTVDASAELELGVVLLTTGTR